MKIKFYRLLTITISILIGYLIGSIFPFSYLSPVIDKQGILVETYQYYDFFIKIFAAGATFFAVIVALFREEIRKLFLYHEILVKPHNVKFLTEVISEPSTLGISDDDLKSAEKYELVLYATNIGKIPAKDCLVCIEEIKYRRTDKEEEKDLEIYNIPLKWIGIQDSKATISKSAKASFSGLTITNEQKHSKGERSGKSSPFLLIGEQEISKKYKSGIWQIKYAIYSADYEPYRYCIQITWDGKWKSRLSDFLDECISFREVI